MAIPLLLNMAITVVQEVHYYYQQLKYDRSINEANTCKRLVRQKNADFRNSSSIDIFETVTWGSLIVGDIIVLAKDEFCPADILILDMWESKCLVKTSFIDDCTDEKIKYSPLLTTISKTSSIKGNLSEYRRILSGRIDLKRTETLASFCGFLNLKKDPISEKFSECNVITKFSQINYSDWVVGIVILAGSETYSLRTSSINAKETQRTMPSHFKRKWNIQSAISIMMAIFFSLIVIIIRISMTCFKSLPFTGQMIPIAIDFIFSFPAYYYAINHIAFIVLQLIGNDDFEVTLNGISSEKHNNKHERAYKLNSLTSFSEIAVNTHVIFNSLRIQNQKRPEVTTVCLKDKYFKLRQIEPILSENNHQKYIEDMYKSTPGHRYSNPLFATNFQLNRALQSQPAGAAHHLQLQQRSSSYKEFNDLAISDPSLSINLGVAAAAATTNAAPTNNVSPPQVVSRIVPEKRLLKQITELDSKTLIPDEEQKRQVNDSKTVITYERRVSISETLTNKQQQESAGQEDDASYGALGMTATLGGIQTHEERSSSMMFQRTKTLQGVTSHNEEISNEDSLNFQTFANNTEFLDNSITMAAGRQSNRNLPRTNLSLSRLNLKGPSAPSSKFINSQPHQGNTNNPDVSCDSSFNASTYRGLTSGTTSVGKQQQVQQQVQQQFPDSQQSLVSFMRNSFRKNSADKINVGQGSSSSPPTKRTPSQQQQQQIFFNNNVSSRNKLYQSSVSPLSNRSSSPRWKSVTPRSLEQGIVASQASLVLIGQSADFIGGDDTKVITNGSHVRIRVSDNDLGEEENDTFGQIELNRNNESIEPMSANFVSSMIFPTTLNNIGIQDRSKLLGSSRRIPSITMVNQAKQQFQSGVCHMLEQQSNNKLANKKLEEDFDEINLRTDSDDNEDDEEEEGDGQVDDENEDEEGREQENENKKDNTSGLNSNQITQIILESSGGASPDDNEEEEVEEQSETSYHKSSFEIKMQLENKQKKSVQLFSTNSDHFPIHSQSHENNDTKDQLQVLASQSITGGDAQCEIAIQNLIKVQSSRLIQHTITDTKEMFLTQEKIELKIAESSNQMDYEMQQDNSKILNNSVDASSTSLLYTQLQQAKRLQKQQMYQSLRLNSNRGSVAGGGGGAGNESDDAPDSYRQRMMMMSSGVPMMMSHLRVTDSQNLQMLSPGLLEMKQQKANFDSKGGFDKAVQDKNVQLRELLFAMAICHETKTKGDRDAPNSQVKHVHVEADTESILDFTRTHDVIFECACSIQEQLYYLVSTEKKTNERVQILNRFTLGLRYVMIVQRESGEKYLFVRDGIASATSGASLLVPSYLTQAVSAEKKIKFEGLFAQMKAQGERIVFYSKKSLTEEEFSEFQNLIRLETSEKDIEKNYQVFLQQQADDANSCFEVLGFIGLEEECDISTKEMVKELLDYGQKVWVLTSDSQERTLESCYKYSILSPQYTPHSFSSGQNNDNRKNCRILDFSSANFDEIFYKTRNHLETLTLLFQSTSDAVQMQGSQQLGGGLEQINLRRNVMSMQSIHVRNHSETVNINNNNPTTNGGIINMNSSHRFFNHKRSTQSQLPRQGSIKLKKTKSQGVTEMMQLTNGGAPSVFSQDNNNNNTNVVQDINTLIPSFDPCNYAMIISGDSLNTIRNDEYLWNHFCLMIFFARSVIGFKLTHEQKAFLGQTIVTKFGKQNQRVINIVSSLQDIERLGYQQISVYIPNESHSHHAKKKIELCVAQHCQLITVNSIAFLKLMFRDSKVIQESVEESMYLALHRSYFLAICIIIWNIVTCACNVSLFKPFETIFFHGFQFAATFLYYSRRKREKFLQDRRQGSTHKRDISSNQQTHNHSREDDAKSLSDQRNFYTLSDLRSKDLKQQLPIFNLKIILMSILDASFVFIFFTSIYDLENGSDLDLEVQRILIQQGVYLLSFCRVFDLHFMKLNASLFMYIVIYVMVTIVGIVAQNERETLVLLNHIFTNMYFWNILLFLSAMLVKNILESLFFSTQPMTLVGLRKYLLEVEKQARRQLNKKKSMSGDKQTNEPTPQKDSPQMMQQQQQQFQQEQQSQHKQETLQQQQQQQQQLGSKSSGSPEILNSSIQINSHQAMNAAAPALNHLIKRSRQYINPRQIIRSIFKDKEMDIILSSMLQDDVNLSQTQMMRFFLKFQIRELEMKFEKSWAAIIAHSNRVFYVIHFIAFDIGFEILVLSSVTNQFSSSNGAYVMSYVFTAALIFILTALTLSKHYQNKNISYISIAIVLGRSLKLILLSSFKQIITYPTEIVLHVAIASSCLRFSHYNLLLQGVLLLTFIILQTETDLKTWNLEKFLISIGYGSNIQGGSSDSYLVIRMCFYLSFMIIVMLFSSHKYYMNQTLRWNFLSEHNLFKATIKVKDILSILLPKFIREKIETMKQGNYRVAEKQDEVVIVFCDICNFDDLIFSEKTNAVKILDKLYRQFDLSCQQNGLQKIETVGKTYLAAAGITDVEKLLKAENRVRNVIPAKRALSFAFDLQKIAKNSRSYLPQNKQIIIKVGVHLGPAISGVIGHHKPQFSLIGDTVNTTSRVCSTGVSGSITISKEVYKKVQFQSSNYKYIQRDVEAKGKGTMVTYQVQHKRKNLTKFISSQNKISAQDDSLIGRRNNTNSNNNNNHNNNMNSNSNNSTSINNNISNGYSTTKSNHQKHTDQTTQAKSGDQLSQIDSFKQFSQAMLSAAALNSSAWNTSEISDPMIATTANTIVKQPTTTITVIGEASPKPDHMISMMSRRLQSKTGSMLSIPLKSIPEIANEDAGIHKQRQMVISPITSDQNLLTSPLIRQIQSGSISSFQQEDVSSPGPLSSSPTKIKVTIASPKNENDSNITPGQIAAAAASAGAVSSPPAKRGGGRILRKANSVQIVTLKPRFKGEEATEEIIGMDGNSTGQLTINTTNNKGNNNAIGELSSPVSPTKNEWIRKIERDILYHIDLEPVNIGLKDSRMPAQKIHANNNNNNNEQQIANNPSALARSESLSQSLSVLPGNLRIGVCSINQNRSSTDQQLLQLEFMKSIMKQQVWAIAAGLATIAMYFLLKVIVLVSQMTIDDTKFVSSSMQLLIIVASVLLCFQFFALSGGFKTMHARLSWKQLRICMYFGYFVAMVLLTIQDFSYNKYMLAVQSYNLNINSEQSTDKPASVVSVAMPSQIIFCLELEIVFMMFTSLKCFDLLEKVGACIIKLVAWLIYVVHFDEMQSQSAFFLVLTGVVHLRIQYIQIQNEVRSFNNMKTLEAKKVEHESLLQNLLPSHILDQYLNSMNKEIPLVCEEHDNVTLLFADIAGFTKYSSTTEPIVVVNMLRKLFTDFDDHCFAQNVYKLYTIGDCYVCFGLTNVKERNPAQEAHNVIRFAFDMIRIIEQVRQVSNCNLQMRIGVHTGKLYGGVVGTEIVRYDVYGVDVIVANKMESNGENGKVMVSEVTRNLLEENYPGQFEFELKEEVHIKQLNKSILGYHVNFSMRHSEYEEEVMVPRIDLHMQQDGTNTHHF